MTAKETLNPWTKFKDVVPERDSNFLVEWDGIWHKAYRGNKNVVEIQTASGIFRTNLEILTVTEKHWLKIPLLPR